MKVAIDLTALLPQPSGVDRYLLGFVDALASLDTETRYAVYVNRGDEDVLSLPPNFSVIAASGRPRVVRLAFQQGLLPLAALLHDVDLVHSPSFIMPLYRGRQAHVLTVHDVTSFTLPGYHTRLRRSGAYRAAVKASIRRADRIIVPSEHVRRELGRLFGAAAVRTDVVPYGVSSEFGAVAAGEAAETAHRLSLPSSYILFVGTLEPRKNLATLIRAYRDLAVAGVDEHLVLAGRAGWGDAGFRTMLDDPVLRGRVHVLGYVSDEDMAPLYARARAFVYPSLEEGFGFPPLEAMASGVPTVCTDTSSLRENLEGAAELVPPTDARALADGLRRVLSDEPLRARLREAGLGRAAQFTWEKTARATLRCYEQAARERSRRRPATSTIAP